MTVVGPTGLSSGRDDGLHDVVDRDDLARRLSELRERAGLSVRDLARIAGLPLGTVGGYLSGRHLPQAATMDQFAGMLVALGLTEDAVLAWCDVVRRIRRLPGRRPAAAVAPYLGLAPYGVDDAPLFVGRETTVDAVVDRVTNRPSSPVVVLAASGSGKSSLLRAGMVAQLRADGHGAVVVNPGPDALASLTAASAALEAAVSSGGGDTARVLVVDQFEEVLLGDASTGAPTAGSGDTWDDIATRVSDDVAVGWPDAGRTATGVADLVERLAVLHASGTTVVIALRADAVEQALAYPELAGWIAAGPVLLSPLSADDLRRVVLEPARRVGVHVDDALVEVLVGEATRGHHDPDSLGRAVLDVGMLPLVSQALYATWASSSSRRLTVAQYRSIGGLAGAIAQSAEGVVADLPVDRLDAVRTALLALVHVTDHHVTAKSVAVEDLGAQGLDDVVSALVMARLLTHEGGQVRLAHEALISAWPRLADWIEQDREALRVHGRLASAARRWASVGEDPDALYRGAQLEVALAWRAGHRSITRSERVFLEASREARDRQTVLRRRSTRRLRLLSGGLALLALSTCVLAASAVLESRATARDRDQAVSRQLAVTAQTLGATDPSLSAQVAAAAWISADTVEARSALLSTTGVPVAARLGKAPGLVNGIALDPSGTILAAVTDRSSVVLWSVGRDPHELARLPVDDGALYGVTFTPDGETLLAGGDTGTLRAWSVVTPSEPAALPTGDVTAGGTLYDVVTDPAGSFVAAGSSDGSVQLWSTTPTLHPTARIPVEADAPVQAVAIDPQGSLLAAAGANGVLTLWDVSDPSAPTPVGNPVGTGDAQITALAWSPDGRTLAAGTTSGVVRLVDVATPATPTLELELTGPASWVNDLAFSPDGSRLVGASSDKQLWVWDPRTGAADVRAATPTTMLAARWSPTGRDLYGSGTDGVLRQWSYPGPVLSGFASIPGQGAFGTAGGEPVVVTATTDGLRTWDATDLARLHPLGAAPPPGDARLDVDGAVDVSPALGLAVAGDTTGSIHVWDIADPHAPVLVGSVQGHTDWVETVAFDATGTRLAVSSDDGTITLWDLSNGLPEQPTGRLTGFGAAVYVVAFSPDGSTLVASVLSGSVRLVDVSDLARPELVGRAMTGPAGYIYSAAMSPDGRTVAATGADGTLWLWDVSDRTAPAALGTPLVWGEGYGTNTAFSPDGSRVAVGMTDGTVRVWQLADGSPPTRWAALSGAAGTVYGVEFSPDSTHLSGAAADKTVRVWDVTIEGALDRACAVSTVGLAMADGEWARVAGTLQRPAPVCT